MRMLIKNPRRPAPRRWQAASPDSVRQSDRAQRAAAAMRDAIDAVSGGGAWDDFVREALRITTEACADDGAACCADRGRRFELGGDPNRRDACPPELDAEAGRVLAPTHEPRRIASRRPGQALIRLRDAIAEAPAHEIGSRTDWAWALRVPIDVDGHPQSAVSLYRVEGPPLAELDGAVLGGLRRNVGLARRIQRLAARDREAAAANRQVAEHGNGNGNGNAAQRMSMDSVAQSRSADEFLDGASRRAAGPCSVGLATPAKASPEPVESNQALGHQAALAIELTRLAEESRRAESARAAAAADRERVAARQVTELSAAQQCLRDSGRDLQTLEALDDYLMNVVRAASTLMDADGGAFGLIDAQDTTLTIRDTFPTADGKGEVSKTFRIDLKSQPHALWKNIAESETCWWADIDDPRFAQSFRDYHAAQGRRHFAHFPVRAQGQPVGFLGFAFQTGRAPSTTAIEVVQILTEHAALAVQVSRLADQARLAAIAREREQAAIDRTRELTQANEALRRGVARLSENVDVGEFLGEIVAEAARQIGAQTNTILLHDPGLDTLSLQRHHVAGAAAQAATPLVSLPASEVRLWARVRQGWLVTHDPDDLASCRRFQPRTGRAAHLTIFAVPLTVGGRTIGFMASALAGRVDVDAEQVESVQALAHQASLALELTRMSKEAREAAALEATSDERNRIAGEIHDSLAQNFTAIAIQSEMLAKKAPQDEVFRETLRTIAQTARVGLAEARATVLALRPLDGGTERLERALEQLAQRCTIRGVVVVSMTRFGPSCLVGAAAANVALRVAQEAVTNALRHARARHIDIELTVSGSSSRLVVRDDGVGFDAAQARRKGASA